MSDLGKVTEQFAHMQANMHSTDVASKGVHSSLAGSLAAVLGINAALKGALAVFDRWKTVNKFRDTFAGLSESITTLRENEFRLEEKLFENMNAQTKLAIAGREAEFEHAQKALEVTQRQLAFAEKANAIGLRRIYVSGLLLGFAAKTSHVESQINDSLLESNSAYANRSKLVYDTFKLQVQTGAALSTSVDALRALVRNGYENEKSLERAAVTVVHLNEGLGMSVDTAAKLAAVVERQVEGSFQSVADTVATIVNNTTLMADEAGRLATNLAQLSAVTRAGGRADMLPEVVSTVSRYESQLRRVGGNIETVERLLAKLTTAEGQLAAGVLGGVSPDFINSARGVDYVMERFRAYSKQMLDGVEDARVRVLRLEQIGQLFGMSSLEVVQLQKSLEETNSTLGAATTAQERFQQQWRSTNEGVARLTRSLVALLQGGLYPITVVVNATINTLADIVQWMGKYKVAVYGAMIAVGVAGVYAVDRLVRMTKALAAAALATDFATAALARYRNEQVKNATAQMLLPGFGPKTPTSVITPTKDAAAAAANTGVWKSLVDAFKKSSDAREAAAKGAARLPYRQQLANILQALKGAPSAIGGLFAGGLGAAAGRIATSVKGGLSGIVASIRTGLASGLSRLTPWLATIARGIGSFLGGIGLVAGSVFTAIAAFGAIFIHYQKKALQAQQEAANSERAFRIQARTMRERQVAIATSAVRYGDFEQAERARALALKQERRDLEQEGASEARIQARLAIINRKFAEAETRGSYSATMFYDPVRKTPQQVEYEAKDDALQKKIAAASEKTAAEFKAAREAEQTRENEEDRRRELDALNRVRVPMLRTGY